MSLTQYITRRTKKSFLTLQDLNIIKNRVDEIWKCTDPAIWKDTECDKASEVWADYQKTMDGMPYDIERIGVMFADVLPNRWPNQIIIGFSLCHTPIDQFDYIGDGGVDIFMRNYKQKKGLGRSIAFNRACTWAERTTSRRSPDYHANSVPPSIRPELKQFIQRAVKYYQDKELTQWAALFIGGE
jgi:hypothetical protein